MVDKKVDSIWQQYEHLSMDELKYEIPEAAKEQRHYKDWSSDEDGGNSSRQLDELGQYLAEPRAAAAVDDPITWWTSQLSRWPRLTAMALDVLSIPPMSDEPERKFSEAGDVVQPRRRRIKARHTVERPVLKELAEARFDTDRSYALPPVSGLEGADSSTNPSSRRRRPLHIHRYHRRSVLRNTSNLRGSVYYYGDVNTTNYTFKRRHRAYINTSLVTLQTPCQTNKAFTHSGQTIKA
ncbi:MAG: hypothetical protein LQ337_008997 [Flavoplaca oasis]|nr:MAG: hypothetical protein LQ337_008997 [Flavoplaca oasis]